MFLFLTGFFVACFVVLPVVAAIWIFALRKKKQSSEKTLKIEQLSRIMGQIAHEIKNPLSTIKVNLQLISEDIDSDDSNNQRLQRKVEILKSETDRVTQVLEDYLQFLRIPELHPVKSDLNKLLSQMVEFYYPQALKKGVNVRFLPSPQSVNCLIDTGKFKQVVMNLFVNSLQAIPEQGEILIRLFVENRSACLRFSDTGKGIAADKLANIFDVYYTSKPGGSGLGLAIAKKIIEAHDGTISVISEPDKGTSFLVTMPLAI